MTIEERNFLDISSVKSPKELVDLVREAPDRLASINANWSQLTGDQIHALIAMDGFALAEVAHWNLWKALLIEVACDGSGQVALLSVVIKRCCGVLAAGEQQVGLRAAEVLAVLGTMIPNCVSAQLLVGLEAACPYWKSSSTAPGSLQSYFHSLLFLAQTLPVLQDKILEFLLFQVILPLDLAVINEDLNAVNEPVENVLEEGASELVADVKLKEKLEVCLREVWQFLELMSKATDRYRDLCYSMIRMFDKAVLQANQPRKTIQILMQACQLDSVVTDRFLGFLTASLFARDAQLSRFDGDNAEGFMSNNSLDARVLMTISTIISCLCAKHGQISPAQQSSTAHLLLQWLERKAQVLELFHDSLFSRNGDYLNPFEVSVCASVWQALLSIMLHLGDGDGLPLLERMNALARSGLISALTLANESIWNGFSSKFESQIEALKEGKAKFLASLKASRQRRQRESLQKCLFKSDGYDSYEPF